MIKIITISLLFLMVFPACNPEKTEDVEKQEVRKEFYELLKKSVNFYQNGNSDKMLNYSKELLGAAQYLNNDSFVIVSYRILGNWYYLRDDYISAIEYYFKGIKLCEGKPDLDLLLPGLYNNIGFNYNKLGVNDKALEYLKKAEAVVTRSTAERPYAYIFENLALTYLGEDQPVTTLHYLKLAGEANQKAKDQYIQASIYLDYGKAYGKLFEENGSPEDLPRAMAYYRKAISFSDSTNDLKHLSSSTLAYGDFLFRQQHSDSALAYVGKSLDTSLKYKYRDNVVSSAGLLQKIYEKTGDEPLAYRYSVLRSNYADSLVRLNNVNQLLALTFNAEMRQKELDAREKEEKELSDRYIQYTLIAIGLITGTVTLLIVTRRKRVSARFINFVGGLGLLIVFEFINLVIHPFIEKYTDHSTFWMLLILVSIAAVLVPLHHQLEHYVKKQLAANNKRIDKDQQGEGGLPPL